MKYVTKDGIELSGDDSREIVRALKRISPLAPERNERDYMKGVAKRIAEKGGDRVRHDSHANFVLDLERLGFLTKVRE
jgi:hypothetical protein